MFDETLAKIGSSLDRCGIPYKIFAGRPRDIEDVRSIFLKGHAIDISYIEVWLREFDAAVEEKKWLDAFRNILHRSPPAGPA